MAIGMSYGTAKPGAVSECTPRNSAKQGVETGLSEMVITRETIGELQLPH
jgi:hypothetical protein